jgi:hypothetical protein
MIAKELSLHINTVNQTRNKAIRSIEGILKVEHFRPRRSGIYLLTEDDLK